VVDNASSDRSVALAREAGAQIIANDRNQGFGRAINQAVPGWERTLKGVPKELYDAWAKHFQTDGEPRIAHVPHAGPSCSSNKRG